MSEEQTDVAALFARLKEELRAAGPRGADVPPAQVRLSVRDQAERLWPVSAERPIVGKGGPVKGVLRRLMRWYVEPAFADQRACNDAVLKQIDESPEDRATRRAVERLDAVALGEARRVFATSRNVADRLKRFNGIDAELLPHPPQTLPYRTGESEGFVLSVNRLDRAKRIDLLIEAAKREPSLRLVITGERPDRERLEQLASGLNGQVEFVGRVDDERLADLYARSLAVYYAPIDEDFGMVPYEAFLSGKPGVTTVDAGGPPEVAPDRETGVVVAPEPGEIARAAVYLA